MTRLLGCGAVWFVCFSTAFAQRPDSEVLPGTWEITAMIDDGAVVPDELLRSKFVQDARLTIAGNMISFLAPDTKEQRSLLFTIDDKANPKTIDLAGAKKVGSQGIYLLSDDVLLLCLAEPDAKQRPADFAARKGSPHIFMTLKRAKAAAASPSSSVAAAPPAAAPKKTSDDDLRKSLLGTWGHQDEDWITLYTLNSDGTFSATRSYKKKFLKVFNEDIRTSGVWKVQDGVVLCTVNASTNKDLRNQVFSYRIREISPTELIAVDQSGALRREWKTR